MQVSFTYIPIAVKAYQERIHDGTAVPASLVITCYIVLAGKTLELS